MLVDVHAHLELCEDIENLITRAKQAGVSTIITNGSTAEANRAALQLSKKYDIVQAALGLYPTDALDLKQTDIVAELEFITSHKNDIVALGEIGLDYKETKDKKKQQKVFEQFLTLGKELHKPVIVHSRKAEQEVVDTLLRLDMKKVILHSCEANMKIIKQATDAGFFLSVPSNLPRSSHWQTAVQQMPLPRILLETDAPFLSNDKDSASEPAHIRRTVETIADLKQITVVDCENALYMNYQQLFLT